jgi:transposase
VPGQIVIADNLSAHKSIQVQQILEEAGCSWVHLPPYSPDFNPIEMLWSQFKSHLRKDAAHTGQAGRTHLACPVPSDASAHPKMVSQSGLRLMHHF